MNPASNELLTIINTFDHYQMDIYYGGNCVADYNCAGNLECNNVTRKCDCKDGMEYNTATLCTWIKDRFDSDFDLDSISDSGSSSGITIGPIIVVIIVLVIVVIIIKIRSSNHLRFNQELGNAYEQQSVPFSNQAEVIVNLQLLQFNSTSYPVAAPPQTVLSNQQMSQANSISASSYDPLAPPPSYDEVMSKV